mmetsp:Transcript_76228/g.202568  ORF Transcript_76228/g.202568 Transcript_76228/m.202568 type:complete len:330 (-) Transcript_76228:97-1086(-)
MVSACGQPSQHVDPEPGTPPPQTCTKRHEPFPPWAPRTLPTTSAVEPFGELGAVGAVEPRPREQLRDRRALRCVLLQAHRHKLRKGRRAAGGGLGRRAVDDETHLRHEGGRARKGQRARARLEQGEPDAPHVRSVRMALAEHALRAHVDGRADLRRRKRRRVLELLGDAEIGQLDDALLDHHVGRLDVTVDLVQLFVQILEPRQHARSDAPARALRHAALPLDHVVECTAVGKLHDDRNLPLVEEGIDELDEVRAVRVARDLQLVHGHVPSVRVRDRRQLLERVHLARALVLGEVNLGTHARAEDLVLGEVVELDVGLKLAGAVVAQQP